MGAVNHPRALGHFVNLINEDGAFAGKVVDNVSIVDYFPAHVDRRAEGFQSDADDVNRPDYAGTKSARLQ